MAEFVEKTGVKTDGAGPNSIDVIADDVMVSAQYRSDRDDCVIFTLPIEDLDPPSVPWSGFAFAESAAHIYKAMEDSEWHRVSAE